MTTRKSILAATAALFLAGIASPAFAEDHVETNEALFEAGTTSQIEPAALPQTIIKTHPKTLIEETFDLTDAQ